MTDKQAAARDRAEREWHHKEGEWRRRVGAWWLVIAPQFKAYSSEQHWAASLRHGAHPHGRLIGGSRPLGDVKAGPPDFAGADAWLREMTADLWALTHPEEFVADEEPLLVSPNAS